MDSAGDAAACVSRRDSSRRLTATASRTFVSSSAASGRPRSAKTLPELATTLLTPLACLAIAHLVICLRRLWAPLNHFTIRLRRARPTWRFLLKTVQDVQRMLKSHHIPCAKRVGFIIAHHLQDTRPETFPRLSIRIYPAILRNTQGGAHLTNHGIRHSEQIAFA